MGSMDINHMVAVISDKILSYGSFAPIAYIIVFTIVPLTLFPDALLAVAGGVIFGLKMGFILTMIGALSGGSVSFFLSRWLGRDVIHRSDLVFEWSFIILGIALVTSLSLAPLDQKPNEEPASKISLSHGVSLMQISK